MKLEIVNTSVVVLAQDHNPSILHPSFLKSQSIVPDDWEVTEAPICTPPLSIVKFSGGIVLTVEHKKLQVTDSNPQREFESSPAPDVAAKYIQSLPHVRYTAVGINMHGFLEYSNPEAMIIEKFLKQGAWNNGVLKPTGLGLRLIYPLESAVLRLSIDSGKIKRPEDGDQRTGFLLDSNYHKDFATESALDDAVMAISLFKQHFRHYLEIVNTIFEAES